ncbi:MAG TPA: hypothetical protein VNO33_19175 [Kofleriaceae bacterium]|nr:hypothetical protein [Kofleriaceae bacterium]
MPGTASALGASVLLLFTGVSSARAEPRQWPASGAVARAGTAVGFSEIGHRSVSTLGGQIAIGYRLGPFVLDAEYESLAMLKYVEDAGENDDRGDLYRVGVTGRMFVLRVGRHRPDPSSLLRLYVEAGMGRQSARWSTGEDFDRSDVSAGAGWLLDHRMRWRERGLPFSSIGWQFGWRLSAARADGEDVVLRGTCKGKGCRPPPMPGPETDLGLLVTCSMTLGW